MDPKGVASWSMNANGASLSPEEHCGVPFEQRNAMPVGRTEQLTELPLVQACVRAKLGYNPLMRLVLRGDVAGRQDERGRWFVSVESLDAFVRRAGRAPRARAARA